MKPYADPKKDMLSSFLEHGISPTVAQRELMTFMYVKMPISYVRAGLIQLDSLAQIQPLPPLRLRY